MCNADLWKREGGCHLLVQALGSGLRRILDLFETQDGGKFSGSRSVAPLVRWCSKIDWWLTMALGELGSIFITVTAHKPQLGKLSANAVSIDDSLSET